MPRTRTSAATSSRDRAAEFVRLFGRAPSGPELARFRRAHNSLQLRLPARSRRRAARLIALR